MTREGEHEARPTVARIMEQVNAEYPHHPRWRGLTARRHEYALELLLTAWRDRRAAHGPKDAACRALWELGNEIDCLNIPACSALESMLERTEPTP